MLAVRNWSLVTPRELEARWEAIQRRVSLGCYDQRKAYLPYWLSVLGSGAAAADGDGHEGAAGLAEECATPMVVA